MHRRLFLISLLLFSAAQFAVARVEMRSTRRTVEISGGEGAKAWKLVYGSYPDFPRQLLEVSPERVYFAHGGWVRLIDTAHGVVIGRWHLGPNVTALKRTAEESVDAETSERPAVGFWSLERPVFTSTVNVGPAARPPLMPTTAYYFQAISPVEAHRDIPEFTFTDAPQLKPERARELLPAVEDMARRDPLSPWIQATYAYLLQCAGDPRAASHLAALVQAPGGDFTEWIPLSAYLFEIGHDDLAQALYDRGYQDLLERGYDPRVARPGYYRTRLFAPRLAPNKSLVDLPPDVLERLYRLGPYPEYGWLMWHHFADTFARQGRSREAQLWRARAHDAAANGRAPVEFFSLSFDRWLVVAAAVFPAFIAFVLIVNRRYTAQHRADIEAGTRQWTIPGVSKFSYWGRAARVSLLLLVLGGWAAMGILGMYAVALVRARFGPVNPWSGTYAGPAMRWYLQMLPGSPERDLLLAMSYQQSGDRRRAEETYRQLPQFAQSWNNLGVILKRQGSDADAREAFQRALQLDPQLREAQFNLDGSSPELWTQLHKQYLPTRPMLAIASPQELAAAYQGGRSAKTYFWSAIRGPFWRAGGYWMGFYVGRTSEPPLRVFTEVVWSAALLFAFLMVFVVRRRPVTAKPGPRHWILELVFPGTAAAWNILGGLVLLICGACCTGIGFWLAWKSPWLFTSEQLSFMRWYAHSTADTRTLLNPSWLWFVTPLAALFVVNAVVVLRARQGSRNVGAAATSTR